MLLDVNVPDSPEALELERLTGIEDAWRIPVKLWCYGIKNRVRDGKLRLTNSALGAIMGRSRGVKGLIEALIHSGFILRLSDERGEYLYMVGWHRNAKYFNKLDYDKKRKTDAERQKVVYDVVGGVVDEVVPTLVPVLVPVQDLQPNLGRGDPDPEAGVIGNNPSRSQMAELEKFYLAERGGALLTSLPPRERNALAEICRATSDPRQVIASYLQDKREYYVKRKWALDVLVNNLAEHTDTKPKPAGDSRYIPGTNIPTAAETKRRQLEEEASWKSQS